MPEPTSTLTSLKNIGEIALKDAEVLRVLVLA